MNKQDWTYKKLGEVATIVGGSTPKSNIEEYWGGTNYWVTPADLNGNKYQGATPRTITDLAVQKTNLQLLPTGTVLLSSRAPIGKVAITTVPMYCNQGFKNIICSNLLLNEFVYWYLLGKVDYLNSLGRGATFKEISKRTTEQIPIPVPPIGEQERIVAELDLLQGIIEKKKEQLKAYDQLAQSIFYTMFGDPIDNPKGWEVKKLGRVCTFTQGIQVPVEEQHKVKREGDIQFLRIIDFTQGKEEPRYVTNKNDKYVLHEREIAIVRYGTPGFICYGKNGAIANNLFKIKPNQNDMFDFYFMLYWLRSDAFQASVKNKQYGAALQAIKFNTIQGIGIILPPLSLQEEFAEKVEAIERQKALVQQSIEETQTMFDCTMDKYFG